jgi:hypothetical protein
MHVNNFTLHNLQCLEIIMFLATYRILRALYMCTKYHFLIKLFVKKVTHSDGFPSLYSKSYNFFLYVEQHEK